MKKITFLTCGGTIDKDYGVGKGVYDFEIGEPYIKEVIKNIHINMDIEVISIMKKDSLDMNNIDRILIKDTIKELSNDKIIITHGTDTLIDTGKYLQDIKNKLIILVGASRPGSMNNSDSEFNIGFALGILSGLSDENKYGVYITMNGEYFNINNVQKGEDGIFRKIK